jgi:uncharacterized protein YbjQ (UPF0145 family)
MLVVTTDSLPGYEVRRVMGEVLGVIARSRNPFVEGIKVLTGGLNPKTPAILARWRHEAIGKLIAQAEHQGANAVIGMRFDNRDVGEYWTEICAYGTAVLVVPAGRTATDRGAAGAADAARQA